MKELENYTIQELEEQVKAIKEEIEKRKRYLLEEDWERVADAVSKYMERNGAIKVKNRLGEVGKLSFFSEIGVFELD